jgi:hypothetical protein
MNTLRQLRQNDPDSPNYKCGEERYKENSVIKAVFTFVQDFEKYWEKIDNEFCKKYPLTITAEEAKEYRKKIIQELVQVFRAGDEIIHYDDFGIATLRCESEKILVKRNGKVIKSIMIRYT